MTTSDNPVEAPPVVAILSRGRVALFLAVMGGVWVVWGTMFRPVSMSPLIAIAVGILIGSSIFLIRKVSILAKGSSAWLSATKDVRRAFRIVVLAESIAVVIGVYIAIVLHHADLAPVWTAIVVGLHFIPLARIFRSPAHAWLGIAITIWCVFCWLFYRDNDITAYACVGTGVLFWLRSIYDIHLGRQAVRALASEPLKGGQLN